MQVVLSVEIMQLEVSAALMQVKVFASNVWLTIFIVIMQKGASVAIMLCRWYFLQRIMHLTVFIVIMEVTVFVATMWVAVSSNNFIFLFQTDTYFS